MAQINVRIPDEDRDKLEEIAKEEDRNISWLVRKAIKMYLDGKVKCITNNTEEN